MATRRIQKELREWKHQEGIFASPKSDDISEWEGVLLGPENTLYEHGVYHFTVKFPSDYPFKPPEVRIVTPILHMGVCSSGCHFCLEDAINREGWKPSLQLKDILSAMRGELDEPFILDRGFNMNLLFMYKRDRDKYGDLVRAHVIKNAIPSVYGEVHGFSQGSIYKASCVPSLRYQCRKQIRFAIKLRNPWNITEDVESLPLPRRMKDFLTWNPSGTNQMFELPGLRWNHTLLNAWQEAYDILDGKQNWCNGLQ